MNAKLINCGNYFNEKSFKVVCEALENGEVVNVYIDCIGHTLNNYEQENYKKALVDKYGDKLIIDENKGAFSFSYNYKLS